MTEPIDRHPGAAVEAPPTRQPATDAGHLAPLKRRPRPRASRLCFTDTLDALSSERGLWRQPSPPPSEARRRLHEALHLAIDVALTERQREAVRLFFFEGLSEGQIARHLGVTQQVIHKHLFGDVRGGRAVGGAILKLKKALSRAGITP